MDKYSKRGMIYNAPSLTNCFVCNSTPASNKSRNGPTGRCKPRADTITMARQGGRKEMRRTVWSEQRKMEGGGDQRERRCSCSWCCTPQKHHVHTHAHTQSTQMHTRAHAVVLRGIRRRCYLHTGTFQTAQQSPPQIKSANGPRNNQMMHAPGRYDYDGETR